MSEKVVVTGAAGFIGSHLCEALVDRGHHVIGLDSLSDNYDVRIKKSNLEGLRRRRRFRFVEGSINDVNLGEILEGAAYVFHLGAQPGVRQSWNERFDDYIDANIRATHRLCEAARKMPLKRFVNASSSSVYGETTRLPMSEAHPTRPVSPYGVTKLSAEALCLLYKTNFQLPVVSLRFFTVYGPRQRPDMAFHKFIKNAIEGRPLEVYGSGTQTRDFTYVSDIVKANLLAMKYDGEESVFNVGGGARITLNVALDILANVLSERIDVRYVEPVRGDVMHTYADISRAHEELGYTPQANLEEGIAKEVDWVRSIRKKFKDY